VRLQSYPASGLLELNNRSIGFIRWCSLLHRNHENFFFGSPLLDWGEQVVVITGGSSACLFALISCHNETVNLTGACGVGELLANTLAVRNVTVVVLDVKPIVTENCERNLAN